MIYHPESTPYYRFESLRDVRHGVFTRLGGSSEGAFASLNVGRTVGDDPARVEANHAAIYATLGIDPQRVVCGRQVHGCHVAAVTAAVGGQVLPDTDALVTDTPGLALMLRFADCVPVLLAAPGVGAVGIAHAGWRGAVARVAARTALAMIECYGCRPSEILAGIGPSIGPCCYQVGAEVVAEVERAFGAMAATMLTERHADGSAYLDLWETNSQQLREVGVTQIESSCLCTRCHRALFFSHRAEGGHTGRFAALIVAPGEVSGGAL